LKSLTAGKVVPELGEAMSVAPDAPAVALVAPACGGCAAARPAVDEVAAAVLAGGVLLVDVAAAPAEGVLRMAAAPAPPVALALSGPLRSGEPAAPRLFEPPLPLTAATLDIELSGLWLPGLSW